MEVAGERPDMTWFPPEINSRKFDNVFFLQLFVNCHVCLILFSLLFCSSSKYIVLLLIDLRRAPPASTVAVSGASLVQNFQTVKVVVE